MAPQQRRNASRNAACTFQHTAGPRRWHPSAVWDCVCITSVSSFHFLPLLSLWLCGWVRASIPYYYSVLLLVLCASIASQCLLLPFSCRVFLSFVIFIIILFYWLIKAFPNAILIGIGFKCRCLVSISISISFLSVYYPFSSRCVLQN